MVDDVRMGRSALRLTAVVTCVAAWIDCGRLHHLQSADSILPALISLQHWTPFFWGQDRFGMLVPLLAMPFRNPFVNLLVQDWLTIVAALVAPCLAARYVAPKRSWLAAGALANACLLVLASPRFQFEWLVTQPYAVSMTLGLAALILVDTPGTMRAVLALAATLLAHWVNLTVCIVLLPLIVARGGAARPRALAVTTAGVAGGLLVRSLSTAPRTTTKIVAAVDWPNAWLQLIRTTWEGMAHPGGLIVLALLVVIAAIRLAREPDARASMTPPATASIAACVYWAVVGTFEHVRLNEYFPRYVFPSAMLLVVAAMLLIVTAWGRRRHMATVSCAALAVAAAFTYGVPSLRLVRKDMDRSIGELTAGITAADAAVVMGDYWTVWPAVFHANLERYERTGRIGIYGLTFRSDPTDAQWMRRAAAGPIVIVAPRFDESTGPLIARIGVPVNFVEDRGPLRIYVTGNRRE